MKDRFKFRAWDNVGKKMWDRFYIESDGGVAEDKETNGVQYLADLPEQHHNILMQCTGLKDRNNRLIYEGDILAICLFDSYNLIFEVKFGTGTYDSGYYSYQGFCLEREGDNDDNAGFLFDERIEVIGNIHENKELLISETDKVHDQQGIQDLQGGKH